MIAAVATPVGRNERMLKSHFILHVQATNVMDSTTLSTAASSDGNHNARLPSDDSDYGVEWAAVVSRQAAANVPRWAEG
jgi:hypothetical protein